MLKALKLAAKALPGRSNRAPVLDCVRIQGGRIECTDMEIIVSVQLPEDTGLDCLAPAKPLLAALAANPGAAPTQRGTHSLTVGLATVGGCLPVEDWPPYAPSPSPAPSPAPTFTMPAPDVLAMLLPLQHVMSKEETRYYLRGVALQSKGNGWLNAVATDGKRLAHNEPRVPELCSEFDVIVPARTVKILCDALKKQTGEVQVSIDSHWIVFAFGNVTITSRLIDGTFPEWRRVVPEQGEYWARANAKTLFALIAASQQDDVELPGEWMESNAQEPIGFQAKYLQDMLAQARGDVTLYWSRPSDPCLIHGVTDTYVLMPYRLPA